MNPDNFGLNRPPFRSLSAYPGPQQLTLAEGLRRCLIAPDSVLVVTGPVGTGKTVSVRHALDRLDGDTVIARIRRTHVDRRELLEQLLDEFGVDPRPESSLKRLNALHEVFRGPGDQRQVFIIVEDAERLGADVLAELESLTAADQDDSPGAHLILLGPPTLEAFLEDPLLLRLNQRVRRRTELLPFSANETRGYIEHCLREAGGTPGSIIDDDAIAVVHDCSGGVARLVNAIAEALLFAASERRVARIDRRFALHVAREDFGYIVSDDEVDEETGIADEAAAEDFGYIVSDDGVDEETGIADEAAAPDIARPVQPAENAVADAKVGSAGQATPVSRTTEARIAVTSADDRTSPSGSSAPAAAPAAGEAATVLGATPDGSRPGPAPTSGIDADQDEPAGAAGTTGDSAAIPSAATAQAPPVPPAAADDEPVIGSGRSEQDTGFGKDTATESPPAAEPRSATIAAGQANSMDAAPDIEDTHPELSAISGIFTAPDHSATDTALGALKNAAAPATDKKPGAWNDDTAGEDGILEPAIPRPTSKSDDPADSQTIRALDDALRPDTQLLKTLDDVGEVAAEEPEAAPTDAADAAAPAAPGPAPRPEADTSMTGTMPTLSEELIADALAEPDDGPEVSTAVPVPSTVTDAAAIRAAGDDTASAEADENDLPMLSLEETATTATADIGPGDADGFDAQAPAPRDDTADTVRLAGGDAAAHADEVALMPEITLDNALEEHQQEQQAKLGEAEDKAAPPDAAEDRSDDEDEEQKRRLRTLAARFSEAKSLEDVMDDTAAETLFGEEFSAIAAAVTNMHKALGDMPDGQEDAAAAANSGTFAEAAQAPAPDAPQTDTQPESGPARAPAAASAPAAPAGGNPAAARPAVPPRPDVDSSAMRRLEMVRALNKKAGKTPPPKAPLLNGAPEEIVLGSDNPGTAGGAAPEPIENQFGPSMTNTLRQLSAENIRKMQEAEEAEEAKKSAKKGGLLGRFRRG